MRETLSITYFLSFRGGHGPLSPSLCKGLCVIISSLWQHFSLYLYVEFSTTSNVIWISTQNQGCQFCSVSPGMVEMFHTNSKNKTKRNKFHLILNLGPFRIFRLNSTQNVPVSFHMFRSALEKSLNQIEPCSI